MLSRLTKQAITHTRHCLTGCGIGEVTGMAVGQNWSNGAQTILAVILAFLFGYSLTFWSARSKIDNISEWLIPGAINAKLHNFLFWWSLALSLAIAFALTVPVNRFIISRDTGHNHNH